MKMKPIERILLVLYAVVGIALLAYAVLIMPTSDLLGVINGVTGLSLANTLYIQIGVILVALALLAWSVWLLLLAFRHEPRGDKGSVSVQNTENGSVRVTVAAMDTLVKQAIGKTEGVIDIKTRVVNHDDSISVKIDMSLSADVHIPNVTMLMQRKIKSFIEEYSGIAVRDVEIMISSVELAKLPMPETHSPEVIVEPEVPSEPEPVFDPEPEAEPEASAEPEFIPSDAPEGEAAADDESKDEPKDESSGGERE